MNIYLYVKTHQKTGLRYLGITAKSDPHKYKGSGKMWKKHLKEYGCNYTTEILFESIVYKEIQEKGKYYSKLWNIVKSNQWANLKIECGNGGWTPAPGRTPWNKGIPMPEEQKKKMSVSKKGKYAGYKNPFYGKQHTPEVKEFLSQVNKGRKFSTEVINARNEKQKGIAKPTVSEKLKGKSKSEEHKEKIRQASLRRYQKL
jgi:hypothetical protein